MMASKNGDSASVRFAMDSKGGMRGVGAAALHAAVLAGPVSAGPITLTLTSTRDNTLFEHDSGLLSNGVLWAL
jgi:hypothetical protein